VGIRLRSGSRRRTGPDEQQEEGTHDQGAHRNEQGAEEDPVRRAGSADQDRDKAHQGEREGGALEEGNGGAAHGRLTLRCPGGEAAEEVGPRRGCPGAGPCGWSGGGSCLRPYGGRADSGRWAHRPRPDVDRGPAPGGGPRAWTRGDVEQVKGTTARRPVLTRDVGDHSE